MKITDVEIFPIYPPLAERYRHVRSRDGFERRVAAKVTTDNGIVGYGDYDGHVPIPASIEALIGTDPFDYIGSNLDSAVIMAMYDIMGKYLEVPAYKLMGQKLRDGVSVASWCWGQPTVDEFRDEVIRSVKQGYTIFKIHTSPSHDMFEWTRAAEEVAPDGFKIHFDFTGRRGRTLGAVLPIVAELERNHPIVGWIEDPFDRTDIESWKVLRSRTTIPIVHGGDPVLGGAQEALHGMADAYMLYPPIGDALATGTALGKMNLQIIMQICGGTLAKSMALHIACVLPTARGHSINLDDQTDEDITGKKILVQEGYSPVPEGPGLGFEVDEAVLRRFAANKPKETPPYVGVVHLAGGHTLYSLSQPNLPRVTGKEEGTYRNFRYDRWFDDGSDEWAKVYERVGNEQWYVEPPDAG